MSVSPVVAVAVDVAVAVADAVTVVDLVLVLVVDEVVAVLVTGCCETRVPGFAGGAVVVAKGEGVVVEAVLLAVEDGFWEWDDGCCCRTRRRTFMLAGDTLTAVKFENWCC